LFSSIALRASGAASAGCRDSLARYLEDCAGFGFTGQVVVMEGDSTLAECAAGRADASGAAVGPATCFAVGSIAKSVTAALIVRLAARGRLSLDDSLAARLPGVPPDKRGIRLRQLLTHTSGLAENGDDTDEDDPRDEVVSKVLATPLVAEPGTRFSYSNAGFELLAAVVERISGRSYADMATTELFAPAGMSGSGTGASGAQRCAQAADARNEWMLTGSLENWRQVWAGTGAGDLVTNARDLARWARTLQGHGPLTAAELDTMLAPRVSVNANLAYGFGVYVAAVPGVPRISIGGDVPGYHAGAWIEQQPPWRVISVVMSGEHFGRRLAVRSMEGSVWGMLKGDSVALPPRTVPWPRGGAAKIAGAWTLTGGAHLELTPDGDGLRLGASGAAAMDLVYGEDSTGTRALVESRAPQILKAAAQPDEAPLRNALHPVERDLWIQALRRGMADCVQRFGPLKEVSVLGTVRLPWLERGRRTYLELRFARSRLDASLAWLDAGLLDVAFGEGRPFPVLLPVSPLAEGGLGAWNILDGSLVRLDPASDRHGPALLVTGPGGRAVARRAKR
jgi:CubicO group peptidase (beta-lactamase class C family)